jgi:DNA-directed RNA polymerase omega subunit
MENNKYLLSVMLAKRVKELEKGAKPLVETKYKKPMMIALEEIKAGKVFIKEKKESLKSEDVFKKEEDSVKVEGPEKPEELSNKVKKPKKSKGISNKVKKPVEIEEIFNKDEESGKSEG